MIFYRYALQGPGFLNLNLTNEPSNISETVQLPSWEEHMWYYRQEKL